jgi:hypothetical protein
MSLFLAVLLPALLLLTIAMVVRFAVHLKFFSKEARDFEDVRWDLKELRIEEFEMLVCPRADEYINEDWNLSARQRRQACTSRLNFTRDWLHRIVENAVLFEQVARFRLRQAAAAADQTPMDDNDLGFKILDRAAMCHFMAAVCLARLHFLGFCRIAWPFYMPSLAGRFEVRGHSLVAWYQHLVEDVLELASQDERDWLHGDLLFMLTGVVEMPELGEA